MDEQDQVNNTSRVTPESNIQDEPKQRGHSASSKNPVDKKMVLSNLIEFLDIPDDKVGIVIGKNGTQIQTIQRQSQCHVQMACPSPYKAGFRQVTLQGTKTQIDQAKALIVETIAIHEKNNGYNKSRYRNRENDQVITVEILIPKESCGSLVGKGGEHIKQLQERFSVKLGLVQNNKEATMPKPLQIIGYPDNVANAQHYIIQRFVNSPNNRAVNEEVTFSLSIARESVGRVIGKNGQMVKRIEEQSGTSINFEPEDGTASPIRLLNIVGQAKQVNTAVMLLRKLLSVTSTVSMHVIADKAGMVIGKGGQGLKQIMNDTETKIFISQESPPNERVFEITGEPHQIDAAVRMMKMRLGEIPTNCQHPGLQVPVNFASFPSTQPYQSGLTIGFSNGSYQYPAIAPNNTYNPIFGQSSSDFNPVYQTPLPSYQSPPSYTSIVSTNQLPSFNGYATPAQTTTYGSKPMTLQAQIMAPYQLQTQQIQQVSAQFAQFHPQPDYSSQWIQFYRDMGLINQANILEQKIKENQSQPLVNGDSIGYINAGVNQPQQTAVYGVVGQ